MSESFERTAYWETTYRAAWVLPVSSPPIADGMVTVSHGKIVNFGPYDPRRPATDFVDLGNVAIIPGLVNAHTHLEFSHLEQPVGQPGIEFTEWVRELVKKRIETGQSVKQNAIKAGLAESFENGVWSIGDIATLPFELDSYDCWANGLPRQLEVVLFLEQLGRDRKQFAEKQKQRNDFLTSSFQPNIIKALSPHAPYSVHQNLLQELSHQAGIEEMPIAMHLAETEAERELLQNQSGPFVDLLKDFGVWSPETFRTVQSIQNILETLVRAPRVLAIHGNYLSDDEMEFISDRRQQITVVYCPRTHEYFGHATYPLQAMIEKDIRIAVGTDSRGSNPDLNLMEELKLIHRRFESVAESKLLEMATIDGAYALGREHYRGTIEIGKDAALSIVTPIDDMVVKENEIAGLFTDECCSSPLFEQENENIEFQGD